MLLGEIKSKVFDSVTSILHESSNFAGPLINKVGDFTPVIGTTFSFIKTAKKVYDCSSPMEALKVGAKSIIIDCTPPVFKYPVLCSAMLVCAIATVYTTNPNFACGAIKCAEIIIDEATGDK